MFTLVSEPMPKPMDANLCPLSMLVKVVPMKLCNRSMQYARVTLRIMFINGRVMFINEPKAS